MPRFASPSMLFFPINTDVTCDSGLKRLPSPQADRLLLAKLQVRKRKEWTAIAVELQEELPHVHPHSAKQVGARARAFATCRTRGVIQA